MTMNTCPQCGTANIEEKDPENLQFRCMQCGTTFYGEPTSFIDASV
ncbi:MAG: hypothetical protein MUP66_00555 [Candidatus Nanohaloarchaeota archaeon QJJ-5]|nr:hypothetical protein [Candidatus Nanohaloarchaeota archaeon QJJ-5]